MQNIGKAAISDVEIVFLSSGQYFVFKADEILPGQKLWVSEHSGASLPDGRQVVCTSFSVK